MVYRPTKRHFRRYKHPLAHVGPNTTPPAVHAARHVCCLCLQKVAPSGGCASLRLLGEHISRLCASAAGAARCQQGGEKHVTLGIGNQQRSMCHWEKETTPTPGYELLPVIITNNMRIRTSLIRTRLQPGCQRRRGRGRHESYFVPQNAALNAWLWTRTQACNSEIPQRHESLYSAALAVCTRVFRGKKLSGQHGTFALGSARS